jgi:hypothetical protein
MVIIFIIKIGIRIKIIVIRRTIIINLDRVNIRSKGLDGHGSNIEDFRAFFNPYWLHRVIHELRCAVVSIGNKKSLNAHIKDDLL